MANRTTRRTFFKQAAFAGAALPAVMPPLVRAASPNGKVNLAGIGLGGKGWGDINMVSDVPWANVIAVCDTDSGTFKRATEKFSKAKPYTDYREMFERHGKDLDGVTVSTPDHTHAPASMAALRRGIATYTQKPLTHTLHEARRLTEAAKKAGVATQMGNQVHSSIGYRMAVDLIQEGAIGKIKEVHTWSNRPVWPQGMKRPAGSDPVPDTLDWNLWLGTASDRPYKKTYDEGPFKGSRVYHPFAWRGWYDFGTGALGDMGCHIIDPVYWALDLTAPKSVSYDGPAPMPESFPTEETITYVFPGTKYTAGDEVVMKWYDGGRKPPRELAPLEEQFDLPTSGGLYIGTKGVILCPHGGGPQLLPREKFRSYERKQYEGHNHYLQWTRAIRGEGETSSSFGYAGPLTETVLLGAVSSRVPDKALKWDAKNLRFTNSERANGYVQEEYRKGFEVEGL